MLLYRNWVDTNAAAGTNLAGARNAGGGRAKVGQVRERQQRSGNRRAVPSFSHSPLFPQGNMLKGAVGRRSGRSRGRGSGERKGKAGGAGEARGKEVRRGREDGLQAECRRTRLVPGSRWSAGEVGGTSGGDREAGGVQEVRDLVFGLRMGEDGFQASSEGLSYSFRQVINTITPETFALTSGPLLLASPFCFPILLLLPHPPCSHPPTAGGFYSFRQVINTINPGTFALTSSTAAAAGGGSAEAGGSGSEESLGVRCVAPDWLGFGGSDKPQADQKRFGYSPSDYARELGNLVATMGLEDVSIVAQGYFCLPAAEFVLSNPARIRHLIFINPPITQKHAKLPSCLSAFSNFLLGEIFAQDPLRASDCVLEEAGCYLIDEEDAMVYRRPYLSSGAPGFALTAITRAFQKDLKASLPLVAKALSAVSAQPSSSPTVIWGMKDRWQSFDGVREACRAAGAVLVTLDEVGHHAQEDYGEEVGRVIRNILRRTT
ncbi:unnamed protein product [Closterium sp. Naga37s-1]|nr:unnamed protein product [Closterium sp. Naga37s-1]